ncbi:hypothetical protein K4H03_28065, partial [Mycobacterium tuberculosis]|nr:hypothetical protein [Mycobacterium tuberculosis]
HFNEAYKLSPVSIPPAPELKITQQEVEKADLVLKHTVERISGVYLDAIKQFETLEALKARLPNG